MARSPKDEPIYNDIQWNYRADSAEGCPPGLGERKQPPISSPAGVLNDNSVYTNVNYPNDVYLNKHFNVQAGDTAPSTDEKGPYNNLPNVARTNRHYGNAMLNLGNGQLVRVYYDENNQQLIVPMNGQYELFNPNQGLREMPLQASQPSHMFTINQDYTVNNNVHPQTPSANQNINTFNQDSNQNQTSNFLKEVIGNWEPNSSGTYTPFGQKYPLNHPDAPSLNMHPKPVDSIMQNAKVESSPKRNENSPLSDTGSKKRIVAEVKPMRPTYSDVLAKNTKNNAPIEATRKAKPQSVETKPVNTNKSGKLEKPTSIKSEDNKHKIEKKMHTNTISSGSESGDITTDDMDKRHKPNKKSKNKRSNMSRKWSSLDDITNEEDTGYNDSQSQFVFIENQAEKPLKKEKKSDQMKSKNADKSPLADSDFKLADEGNQAEFVYQDGQMETKSRKKKSTNYHKAAKPAQDKKKNTQTKLRRNKPGYLGLAQNYLEHWAEVTWKAVVWFFYLLSDICRMSAHLSFDLCTSVFTQTYVSSQAVWRSSKDYLSKIGHNKYLQYIDRKLGHTRFGFWRKLKWFKKESELDNGNDSTNLNANIPLPATGEEAMKRLLACKGKDPYSILGVSETCTDEEIKRYYRRQAFLVHPDKNQQPGAEEAFKILQHAFDLIGEPERRSAYSRRALESKHAEAAWGELSALLAQLHDKMHYAANTIRCTNCGRRHKRVLTERPCYAARYCTQCKIRHSAKEGDIWAESSMMGLLVMYYACMDGGVYQITQWASCQKKNLKQLRPDCHVVQYRIVLGNKASNDAPRPNASHEPNLEEFLNSLYNKQSPTAPAPERRSRKARP